jgi:hypothetical protein
VPRSGGQWMELELGLELGLELVLVLELHSPVDKKQRL